MYEVNRRRDDALSTMGIPRLACFCQSFTVCSPYAHGICLSETTQKDLQCRHTGQRRWLGNGCNGRWHCCCGGARCFCGTETGRVSSCSVWCQVDRHPALHAVLGAMALLWSEYKSGRTVGRGQASFSPPPVFLYLLCKDAPAGLPKHLKVSDSGTRSQPAARTHSSVAGSPEELGHTTGPSGPRGAERPARLVRTEDCERAVFAERTHRRGNVCQ